MPDRVQRKRERGWKMPENTIYVGRPSRWGNPHDWRDWLTAWRQCIGWRYDAGDGHDWCRDMAAQAFDEDIRDGVLPDIANRVSELRGKNLACWCPLSQPCHADVLLKLANEPA